MFSKGLINQLHCPKNYLNLHIKTNCVRVGADTLVSGWARYIVCKQKPNIYSNPDRLGFFCGEIQIIIGTVRFLLVSWDPATLRLPYTLFKKTLIKWQFLWLIIIMSLNRHFSKTSSVTLNKKNHWITKVIYNSVDYCYAFLAASILRVGWSRLNSLGTDGGGGVLIPPPTHTHTL